MNKTSIAQQSKVSSFVPHSQSILQRKCACGNHTAGGGECAECAKKKMGLQRKLAIGASNDPLEQEADQVMAASGHSAVNTTPLRIQRFTGQASEGANAAPDSVDRVLAGSGRPLDPVLRQDMEQRFGHDFSRVRVHTDSAAEQSARDVNANAYTVENNVMFGAGQFAPNSNEGKWLIAHELTHTIQQESLGATDSVNRQETSSQRSSVESGTQPVYVCTKPILGSTLHQQGHAFFRVGGSTPGHPTYELEHARSCYCGWQGWPRRNVPEDRDASVPCVLTTINSTTLAASWNRYPVGQYCARGPNSNTYVRVISAIGGSKIRPPGNTAGYDANPPVAGGAGAPHPFLSVVTCWSVDCDDTECGLIPGINSDINPGHDPETLDVSKEVLAGR